MMCIYTQVSGDAAVGILIIVGVQLVHQSSLTVGVFIALLEVRCYCLPRDTHY